MTTCPHCSAEFSPRRADQVYCSPKCRIEHYHATRGDGALRGAITAVRRLTPTECERLMGTPDGHTLIPYRNKPAKDGPRYRALGNSMAVPIMRYIGEQIASANAEDA